MVSGALVGQNEAAFPGIIMAAKIIEGAARQCLLDHIGAAVRKEDHDFDRILAGDDDSVSILLEAEAPCRPAKLPPA